MVKNIVCVFAHPDDEAFGPGGTIAKLSKTNNVYLLCATKGDAGQNSTNSKDKLSDIRSKELLNSAKVLGIKKVFFLGFKDGTLNNNNYHELASEIKKHLLKLRPSIVLTFEPQGVTGHIDHITVSMSTMFAVQKLKFVKSVMQFCRPKDKINIQDYFIYLPEGYEKSEIDVTVDVKDVWDIKLKAMNEHKSQDKDIKRFLKRQANSPREEYFLVVKN